MTQIDYEATAKRIIEGWHDSYGGGLIHGGEVADLIAAVAAALAYGDGQIAGLHESLDAHDTMIKDLKAERDASFVEGLKRAKEIALNHYWAHAVAETITNLIQAEIDKAGKRLTE